MISIEELKKIGLEKNLNLGQIELNYMHTLFLYGISKYTPENLVFKGGTSLMICYNLDRFSEDLDFNLTKDINLKEILEKIVLFFKKFNLDSEFKFKRETKSSKSYFFLIKGPLYMGKPESVCKIELDFSFRKNLFLEYKQMRVKHEFEDFPFFYLNTLSLDEIFSEKVRCILTRNKSRDIYDLFYLIERKVKLDIDLINKKLDFYSLKFDLNLFLSSIKNKEKLWNNEMNFLVKFVPDFKEVYLRIEEFFK